MSEHTGDLRQRLDFWAPLDCRHYQDLREAVQLIDFLENNYTLAKTKDGYEYTVRIVLPNKVNRFVEAINAS